MPGVEHSRPVELPVAVAILGTVDRPVLIGVTFTRTVELIQPLCSPEIARRVGGVSQLNPTRCAVNVSVLVNILVEIKGTVPIRVELVEAGIQTSTSKASTFVSRRSSVSREAMAGLAGFRIVRHRSKIGGELIRLTIIVGQGRPQWSAAIPGQPTSKLCLSMFRATKEEPRRAEFDGCPRELTIELKAISCSGSGGVISVEASKAKYWDEGLW